MPNVGSTECPTVVDALDNTGWAVAVRVPADQQRGRLLSSLRCCDLVRPLAEIENLGPSTSPGPCAWAFFLDLWLRCLIHEMLLFINGLRDKSATKAQGKASQFGEAAQSASWTQNLTQIAVADAQDGPFPGSVKRKMRSRRIGVS